MIKTKLWRPFFYMVSFVVINLWLFSPALMATDYYGHHRKNKKEGCSSCHKKQWDSWRKMRHAKAMISLKPGKYKEEKLAANLDPTKDYRKDKKCLKCHTTGFEEGGFKLSDKASRKILRGVGCEACHGAGGDYMTLKDEDDEYKRSEVIKLGLSFGEEKQCLKCHNDDSPFNEKLDSKYAFGYKKSVTKGTHKHYKLKYHTIRKGSEWLYK